jgi:plasmid stabilization system protein ParE
MEIRWLDDALADVTLTYRHTAGDDPRAAAGVVPRTRYIVPYRVTGELVEILRVLHSARRWPDEPLGD